MEKEEVELRGVRVSWWNNGRKTLDFEGTLKDCLKDYHIKVTRTAKKVTRTSGNYLIKGYRFTIPLCYSHTTFTMYSNSYITCANEAIKIHLLLLGDKAEYIDPYTRVHRIH